MVCELGFISWDFLKCPTPVNPDKTYKLCSRVNHDKALYRAISYANVTKTRPIFDNMYSDLKSYPSLEAYKKSETIVPPWLLRDYATYLKGINSYLVRYEGYLYDILLFAMIIMYTLAMEYNYKKTLVTPFTKCN